MNLIITHATLLIKYILLFSYFYFSGRSFLEFVRRYFLNNKKILQTLHVKKTIIYPLVGIVFIGNLLIIVHFIFPLKSIFVLAILIIALSGNLFNLEPIYKISFDSFNLLYYVVIPSILIFSAYDTSWHYDAGFYHLNHQNWLRESNMIFGTVNISWTFGMSSVYEYISSVLWIDKSFILIHFFTLIFIQTFYIYLIENIRNPLNIIVKNISILLILYSLLDNFGLNGGRNGFLYIQGVAKQDMAVAIIVLFISISSVMIIKSRKVDNLDILLLSILVLFAIQIKISSAMILYPALLSVLILLKKNILKPRNLFFSLIPSTIFFLTWILKNYMTTGCFIFPVSFTCINNFDWYIPESTKDYESISTTASYSLIDYLYDNKSLQNWFSDFISIEINRIVTINFLISFVILFLVKFIFTNKEKIDSTTNFSIYSYLVLYTFYLLLFGPIPRYLTGLLIVSIAFLGINIKSFKININNIVLYSLTVVSLLTIVRFSSYSSFFDGANLALFDPVGIAEYFEYNNGWVRPEIGDQCWINLDCTMERLTPNIIKSGYFNTAYK